jgi:hypothetical protein
MEGLDRLGTQAQHQRTQHLDCLSTEHGLAPQMVGRSVNRFSLLKNTDANHDEFMSKYTDPLENAMCKT